MQANKEKKSFPLALIAVAVVAFSAIAAAFLGYSLFPSTRETRFQAAGVDADGTGAIIDFVLRSRPGSGALLVNVANAEWREDAEQSLRAARGHAEALLGVSLEQQDYDLTLSSTTTEGVGGGSAGAAIAVAIIANYYGAQPRGDALASAALDAFNYSNDELQPVGGGDEKILAAANAGKRVFVIAQNQELKYEGELAKRIQIKRVRTLREVVTLFLRPTTQPTQRTS